MQAASDNASVAVWKERLHQHADGPNVASGVGRRTGRQFGGGVAARAAKTLGEVVPVIVRKTQVDNFDGIVRLGNQDVGRGEVVVDDAFSVQIREYVEQLLKDTDIFSDSENGKAKKEELNTFLCPLMERNSRRDFYYTDADLALKAIWKDPYTKNFNMSVL